MQVLPVCGSDTVTRCGLLERPARPVGRDADIVVLLRDGKQRACRIRGGGGTLAARAPHAAVFT